MPDGQASVSVAENLRIWNRLKYVPPERTKAFGRAGFKGTDINPQWRIQAMTEAFGPCGIGWGVDEPQFNVIPLPEQNEVMVYCWVRVWIDVAGEKRGAWGVGGDKVVVHRATKNRTDTDDEAFKKAFTDAFGNAMRFFGVAADVYLGKWDDSKYQAELHAALEQRAAEEDPVLMRARELIERFDSAESPDDFSAAAEQVTQEWWKELQAKSKGTALQLKSSKDAAEARLMPQADANP